MAQGSSGAAAIRVLLDELHAELLAAPPELDEPKTLEDNLSALTLDNAQGRRVLVPRETWPSYECLEHNGTGWEALIEKVVNGNARVRFLYATTTRGVRYAESDLELAVLIPLWASAVNLCLICVMSLPMLCFPAVASLTCVRPSTRVSLGWLRVLVGLHHVYALFDYRMAYGVTRFD